MVTSQVAERGEDTARKTSAGRRSIRLFMVDDHALFREGLVRLLTADPDFDLVGIAAEPQDALTAILSNRIDVLLLDYALGGDTAGWLVSELRARGFAGRILLVTAGLPDREALQMIRLGVAGIFHKQHTTDDLKRSIREVFEGRVLIDEHYLRKLAHVAADAEPRSVRLTDRERQVVGYLMEGLANKEIAAALNLSESAVKAALQVLFNKTGVRTRSQLVRVALEDLRDELTLPGR
jgi:two-component system, NarL family, nitrate/nitrite response regulator NarL